MKTKYMVVSGFLGAGKTTAMIAFARNINGREKGNAAIIANDLGAGNVVDAEFTAAAGIEVLPISGGCICYQHENLVGKMKQLERCGANIIFSDIPGCGIGALDHVYLELNEKEKDEFELLPFMCIVDPERMKMVMNDDETLNLPEELKFLLGAQMAEADMIVLNKTDIIDEDESNKIISFIKDAYPDKQVMAMSSLMGAGVSEVVDYALKNRSEAIHREIGYESDEFVAAEEKLSWFNTRVYMQQRNDKNLNFNDVIEEIFEEIRSGLIKSGGNVPHLKMFAADSEEELTDFFKASLIGVDYEVIFDKKLEREYSALSLIINARCSEKPVVMAEIVGDAVELAADKYDMKVRTFFMETFGMMEEGKGNIAKASRYK